jgi:hypothetical protein
MLQRPSSHAIRHEVVDEHSKRWSLTKKGIEYRTLGFTVFAKARYVGGNPDHITYGSPPSRYSESLR